MPASDVGREPRQGEREDNQGEHRHTGPFGGLTGGWRHVQVSPEESAENQVLHGDGGQPRHQHQPGEPGEGKPAGGERNEVGQVGDRQQQRGGVRQVSGAVDIRLGACVEPGGGGKDYRGEQHHRGVQAQHRGGGRGDDEDPGEEPGRPSVHPACHPGAAGAEQSLVLAQLGQDQDSREEPDNRAEPLRLGECAMWRDRANRDDEDGRRDRRNRLGPPPRTYYRKGKHQDQHRDGNCLRRHLAQHALLTTTPTTLVGLLPWHPRTLAPPDRGAPGPWRPRTVAPRTVAPPDRGAPGPWHPRTVAPPDRGTPGPWHPRTVAPPDRGTPGPWHPRTVAPPDRGTPGPWWPTTVPTSTLDHLDHFVFSRVR